MTRFIKMERVDRAEGFLAVRYSEEDKPGGVYEYHEEYINGRWRWGIGEELDAPIYDPDNAEIEAFLELVADYLLNALYTMKCPAFYIVYDSELELCSFTPLED